EIQRKIEELFATRSVLDVLSVGMLSCELLYLFLVARGAGAMAERTARFLLNVALDQIPVVMFVAHLAAIDADRNHFLELTDFRRVLQNALRYPQADSNGFAVQRLGEKVIHSGRAGQLIVMGARMVCGEKDKIGVGSLGARP